MGGLGWVGLGEEKWTHAHLCAALSISEVRCERVYRTEAMKRTLAAYCNRNNAKNTGQIDRQTDGRIDTRPLLYVCQRREDKRRGQGGSSSFALGRKKKSRRR